ncbi:hypothetical protein PHIN6_03160 [Polynucleobacter sp. HIN6]|uniref:recombinase RecT n=1 Tax=Polynucleobacter sp. HIN6 TaxID=3047865 RepID=UPI002573D735|nr:recombinase RecT [Polynucleobacter sp. HIN6]BEI34798.1 hypothetical protein PHIN6_03160 [Polynucleobacter sp. HIN6]
MSKISILDMSEDLLDEDRSEQTSSPKKLTSENWTGKVSSSKTPLKGDNFITDVAKALEITKEELCDWVQEAALPEDVFKAILKIAKHLKLNPLMGHIDWELNPDGKYELFIPIDGWITLIHREPTFQGITFNQSPETDQDVPIWIECSIYRSDLTHPITVREYYVELKTNHPIWQQMPRRMLRHKTLQQCARLAFGIIAPELNPQRRPFNYPKTIICSETLHQMKPKQVLKEVLSHGNIAQ